MSSAANVTQITEVSQPTTRRAADPRNTAVVLSTTYKIIAPNRKKSSSSHTTSSIATPKDFAFSYRTMKISGIGSLFSAAISPTTSPKRATPVEEIRPTTPVDPQADAVVVSSRIKQQQEQAESANADRASRREKVAEQVKAGTYKPDTTKVAESLVRDLM